VWRVRLSQDLHSDERDVVRLPLFPEVISHFIHDPFAHLRGSSGPQTAERIEQSVVSEIFPGFTCRLGNAIAEDEQPIPGNKRNALLKRRQDGNHTRRRSEAFQPDTDGIALFVTAHKHDVADRRQASDLGSAHRQTAGISHVC
jgi:hypothetical protein